MDIGHRIRELREARELTVRVLSDRTGLAENSIARIERGERMPGATSVEAIARGLGVAPGALFEDPVLLGKGEAPEEAGPSEEERRAEILNKTYEAVVKQAKAEGQAFVRAEESAPLVQTISQRAYNEAFKELVELPVGDLADLVWDAMNLVRQRDLGERDPEPSGPGRSQHGATKEEASCEA